MKHLLKFAIYLAVGIGFSAAHAGSYEDWFKAVRFDDAGTVAALLRQGFDPNAPDESGQTGLTVAVREDSDKVAATLLAAPGIRIDTANAAGETALMLAALRGRGKMVRLLLDKGAQVNRSGWTPLHYAASGPDPKVVALLLDRGAAIDAASPNGSTPLMMASRYGSIDSAELLLARGGDARARNALGLTATDFARTAGRDALAGRLAAAAR